MSRQCVLATIALSLNFLTDRGALAEEYPSQSAAFEECKKYKAYYESYDGVTVTDCEVDFVLYDFDSYILDTRAPPGTGAAGHVFRLWYAFPSSPPTAARPEKNRGKVCGPDCPKGDPINAATGNKYEERIEYRGAGPFPLEFGWTYNSSGAGLVHYPQEGMLGSKRSNTFSRHVSVAQGPQGLLAYVARPDGNVETFNHVGSLWQASVDNAATLTEDHDSEGVRTGWRRVSLEGEIERFRADGRLIQIQSRSGLTQSLEYDAQDRLNRVVDPTGRHLQFDYNPGGRVDTLTLPNGQSIHITYQTGYQKDWVLASVQYPGPTTITYLYDENDLAPGGTNLLTGVIDENRHRLSSTSYSSNWWATGTSLAGQDQPFALNYASPTEASYSQTSSVATPEGSVETNTYSVVAGKTVLMSKTVSCSGCSNQVTTHAYDSQGRLASSTDLAGTTTTFVFTTSGLLTKTVRSSNKAATRRTTEIDWDSALRLPVEQRTYDSSGNKQPGSLIARRSWSYNARGQLLSQSEIDVSNSAVQRTQSLAYCEQAGVISGACPLVGLLLSVDEPHTDISDVTTYSYYLADAAGCDTDPSTCAYRRGDLRRITDAVGNYSEALRYDGAGKLLSSIDANGVVTDFDYSPLGWLVSRKVRGPDQEIEADDAITRYEYDGVGNLTKKILPDGSHEISEFDDAHQLVAVEDGIGNRHELTLDDLGSRTAEKTLDPQLLVRESLTRSFDGFGRLASASDSNGRPMTFSYHATGQLGQIKDRKLRIHTQDWDPLRRLTQAVENSTGFGSERAATTFAWTMRDRWSRVTDPLGLQSIYLYGTLGNFQQLSSPDAGISTYRYDISGQRTGWTDGRGMISTFTYDAAGRLTGQLVGQPSQNAYFDYDVSAPECSSDEQFAKGRPWRLRYEAGETRYCYDRFGNRTRSVQTVSGSTLSIETSFDLAGRPTAISYPSGAIVAYLRDDNGSIKRIDAVPAGKPQSTLVSDVSYLPFGPASTITFSNGRVLTREFDKNYRIDKIWDNGPGDSFFIDYSLNAEGSVASFQERLSPTVVADRAVVSDGLGRITSLRSGSAPIESYSYDANDNRLTKTLSSQIKYSFQRNTNRLASVGGSSRTYDSAGNTLTAGTLGFVYDARGRLGELRVSGALRATYKYDAEGRRVQKVDAATPANSRLFVYDEPGHLMGEYMLDGTPVAEYVWLDDTPIAVIREFDGASFQFVETDHLNTPRAVVHPSQNKLVWRWPLGGSAFGDHAPVLDPDGDGLLYSLSLRLPGQYADAESSLFQNGHRYFEPATGRYTQPDPIGVRAGTNLYSYAHQRPFEAVDPSGLTAHLVPIPRDTPAGSIYCVDGEIVPAYNWNKWPPAYRACRQAFACVERHELQHRADALKSNPNVCPPKRFLHFLLGPRPQAVTFDNRYNTPAVVTELEASELRAHATELRCLSAALRSASCDAKCRAVLMDRVRHIMNVDLPNLYPVQEVSFE